MNRTFHHGGTEECEKMVAFWLNEGRIDWPGVLLVQTPVTLGVILWEMLGPWYHGIFARRVNAQLDGFLQGEI